MLSGPGLQLLKVMKNCCRSFCRPVGHGQDTIQPQCVLESIVELIRERASLKGFRRQSPSFALPP
jgi:hypothetical protein